MDKLKENAFVLGLAGAGIVLLAAAYFLVYQPWSALSAQQEKLESAASDLARLEDAPPTEERYDRLKDVATAKKEAMDAAVTFYDERAGKFALYFGDTNIEPSSAEFFGTYNDQLRMLLQDYRDHFQPVPDRNGVQPPKIEKAEPEGEVRLAQRKFWIIEAIINAATQHEVGGLALIDFEKKARRSAREIEAEADTLFITDTMGVIIHVNLSYSKLGPFLRSLYASDRVPFVDAKEITFSKTNDELEKFVEAKVQITADNEGFTEDYASVVQEPQVLAKISLSVLGWGGRRPTEEPVGDDDDDDGEF